MSKNLLVRYFTLVMLILASGISAVNAQCSFTIEPVSASYGCFTTRENVVWTSLVNTTAIANDLTKSAGAAWTAGAFSSARVYNNGHVETVINEVNTARMIGLANTNPDANFTSIPYALSLRGNGTVEVIETNINRGNFGAYAAGDTMKIKVERGLVRYYRNSVLLYSSTVPPTLPLFVDCSFNQNGATLRKVVIVNTSNGSFQATAYGAGPGASPTYQWKLNGADVGTNSSTYTNTALATNDLLTCVLTPGAGGCSVPAVTSNNLVVQSGLYFNFGHIYVQGTASTGTCKEALEAVVWDSTLTNLRVTGTGNSLLKVASNGNWNGGAASLNRVKNYGYLQFTATETNTDRFIGLSTSNANNSNATIQYAIALTSTGAVQIWESNTNRGAFGTYASNDVFKVFVDAGVVKYYKNGGLLYVSTVLPTLPLLADVSINSTNGTVTNAVISNVNAGTFTAEVSNAGAAPIYQWKLNGADVGTNSNTYTNATLNNGDVVSCVVTPSTASCAGRTFTSNTVTNLTGVNPVTAEFYIQGTPALAACLSSDEVVVWRNSDLSNVTASGNNLNKFRSAGAFDGGAASWNTVSNNGALSFTATETNTDRYIGLSTANANSSNTSIQYAFYLRSNGAVEVRELGTSMGTFGTYATNDVFKIAVENGVVRYYRNGTLLYSSATPPVLPLLVDVSIEDIGGTVTNAIVSNYNTGSFTATAVNAGATPSYQWKLNGADVGTNSASYSNAALVATDVVTCVLTPSLSGCATVAITSNSITQSGVTNSATIDYVIQSGVATSACNFTDEQVRWKNTDYANVVGTSNNLVKVRSNGVYDGGAASWNTVSNNGSFSFTATETNTERYVGLSSSNANSSNTSIQYAFQLLANGTLQVRELGVSRGTFGTYASNDVFRIAVEAGVVKYYRNGALLYISNTTPTLPLLVDVSIFTINGTVTNAVVSNLSSGLFTATTVNAGATPTYQWQLNAGNVGTNSATYTNTLLADNDVVTCIITPNLDGCSVGYTSNAIANRVANPGASVDFYVQGTVATTACNTAEEAVVWRNTAFANVQGTGNSLLKIQSNGVYDGGAASWNTVSANGYFQFTATEVNRDRTVGLSNANANSSNTSIQFAFVLTNAGAVQVMESGTGRGTFGTYVSGDVFRIAIEGTSVRYFKNGTLLYISTVAPTLPLLVDVSIEDVGGTVTNAIVSNYNTGTFTATATNAGATPAYQWKLNGADVGTNSATYTNTTLVNGDIVTCELTPSLSGCASVKLTSNAIVNRPVTAPSSIEFVVTGSPSTTGCQVAEEQVRWKSSDLQFVLATGNNLSKFQSGGNWNGGAASWNTVANNGYFEFTATETNSSRYVGLSSSNLNASNISIQYAFSLTNTSTFQIIESNVTRVSYPLYAANDVFRISVESGVVKYYRNGTLLYISAVTPTLPLIADVSINSALGTVTNAVVGNYNVGSFVATATNAGPSPSYQWKLNGANVGINSNSYSNTLLSNSDVVTCVLTPDLAGCTGVTISSNSVTARSQSAPLGMEIAITATTASTSCNIAEEQVQWKTADLLNVQATGNNLVKVQTVTNWDGGAASWNTVSNNGYFEFTAQETILRRMAGLSTTNADANFTTIRYAFYLLNNATVEIYEAGTSRGLFGTYSTGDVFRIAVESNVVKYYQNGTLLYISTLPPTLPLLVDVSIRDVGATITDAKVANYNLGVFNAVANNVGALPVYQWKLNGADVGTNSATYTNTALSDGDVLSCLVTPDFGGCAGASYSSNTITNIQPSNPVGIEFYIAGNPAVSACGEVREVVRWKVADLQNVQATSNDLIKLQSNGYWNGGAASWNTVVNNGYFEFTASEMDESRMAGLSSANANSDFTTIQYAFYLVNNNNLRIYELGANIGLFGSYSTGDILRIAVEGGKVNYYQNGNLLYTSTVTPVLPMLADVSIRDVGGTITNAIISNYNTGSFTAVSTNSGASPVYQWYLNGAPVGSGGTSYVNAAISAGDVVTCVLTPDIAGCASSLFTSNSATFNTLTTSTSTEVVVQGTVAPGSCFISEEKVLWKIADLNNTQATANDLRKIQSNGNWNGGASSWNTVGAEGYLQFVASEVDKARMVGLSSSSLNSDFTSIQYAIYLQANNSFNVYESGANRGVFGNYALDDTFKIAVVSNVVKYYRNNNLFYASLLPPTLPLVVDVSIRDVGGTVTDAIVANNNAGSFVVSTTNAGATPTYQWQLNGANVGANATTYTNAGLSDGDIVNCLVTPSAGGCSSTAFVSNEVIYKSIILPTNVELYVTGTVASTACNTIAEEEVKWKFSDLVNVNAVGGDLTKISSNGNWDGGAASWNTVAEGGYFQFVATETNRARMAGLSSTNTNSNFNTIRYAFYLRSNGRLEVYETGNNRGDFGTYATNDTLRITVESNVVKYYKNRILIYVSALVPTLPLLADVSINTVNGTITSAVVGNLNGGTFVATALNAGSSLSYQWKLNGADVGTNSDTYVNTTLNPEDVLSCVLSPSIGGCGPATYTSNIVTNKAGRIASTTEVYIQGSTIATTCYQAEEDVQWNLSSLTNVQATLNKVLKITSNNAWNGGAFSWNSVKDNGYFQFKVVETDKLRLVGLSSSDVDANFTSIQYGFYLNTNATMWVTESGVQKAATVPFTAGDVLRIAVESGVVNYYQNGTLLYTSVVPPVLPLFVDISINVVGGTVSDAVIANPNLGTFVASTVNAGATPNYQWKRNGVNVGTNSNTYTNASLTVGDIITCVVTPVPSTCNMAYTSNAVKYNFAVSPPPYELYAQGTVATSACLNAEEQVVWKNADLVNVTATSNNLLKTQSNNNWDGGASSWNTVKNNGYLQFVATETNRGRIVGLSTSNASANQNTIAYGIYLQDNAQVSIQELGNGRGYYGSYSTNDVFKIAVESGVVNYYRNGTLLYSSLAVPTLPLLVDVSILNVGGTVTNAVIGNANDGTFTATTTGGGAAPVYQWKLNGVNVGTNSSTYVNPAVVAGDVVVCEFLPDFGVCSVPSITNTVTLAPAANSSGIDFYVQGTPVSAACISAEEAVKWKISSLNFVQATNNDLNKFQSNASWDGNASSWNTVREAGYFEFTASEINRGRTVGLSSTDTDDGIGFIQYAFFLQSNATFNIYETNVNRGNFGAYAANDVFRISVEANVVKYYRNGSLVYSSVVVPVLPLLVDVSIRDIGGTVTNAVVSNYNDGSYVATAINAGATPIYQWKLNGVDVGTNSATYTNPAPVNGDVVTCVLSPSIGGCTGVTYTSNTITSGLVINPIGIDFYVEGQVSPLACLSADENVQWKITSLSRVEATTNNLEKLQSNGNWNGGASSWNTVKDNGYFRFIATETNRARYVGLSSTDLDASNTTIQFAFYLLQNTTLQVVESGTSRGTFGNYDPGDTLQITVESGIVKYYNNSVLLYVSGVVPTLPLLVDVSIRDIGGTVTKAVVSNYNSGVYMATAVNAGATPTYQWKLNGANVGTNSATYTNPTPLLGDVVSCELTPSINGCAGVVYTSNDVTSSAIKLTTNVDVAIMSTVATSTCNNTVIEKVKWKKSDLLNVTDNNGNLNKMRSNNAWDGGAASWNTVANNGYFEFTASETNRARMVGLSTSNASANNTTIQYAFSLANTSALSIVELGVTRASVGTYATNDVLRIAVVSGVVRYFRNGVLVYTSLVPPVLPLLVDVSINQIGGTVNNAVIMNNSTGTFTATATNAGATPSYQWKVNGTNVGTNSATYTNIALNDNDIVTCVLTPSTSGCTSAQYTSNAITFKRGIPTAIVTQPIAQSACLGGSATFTVGAIGTGITYQWQLNGTAISGATAASHTVSPVGAGDAGNYSVIVTSDGCSSTSNAVALTVQTTNTWNGSVSTDWFTAANWSCGLVPTALTNVVIPAAMPRYPNITASATATARNINIALGASVSLAVRQTLLQINGDWTNQGTFTAGTGTVEFTGAAATQTIVKTPGTEKFFGLTVNKSSGSVVVGATSSVDIIAGGTVNVTAGTLNLNTRPFVLKSAPNGSFNDGTFIHSLDSTARLANVTGGITNATAFAIERYISAPTTKPRMLCTPVQNMTASQWADSVTIFGGNFRSLPGFPTTTSTLYWYNEPLSFGTLSKGFAAVIDKNSVLTVGRGYRLIVGYDNNPLYTNPPKPAVTIKMTGVPFMGSMSMPVTKTGGDPYGWNMLGNPYPCELSWSSVYTANSTTLSATMAILDPKASGTSDYFYYNAFTNTAIDPRYSVGAPPATFGTSPRFNQGIISTSQAFFVFKTGAGAGNVNFTESQKVLSPGMHESNFRISSTSISSTLNVVTVTSNGYSDNAYLFIDNNASGTAFDPEYDAYKFSNTNVTISTNTSGRDMAMNGLAYTGDTTVIPMHISTKHLGTHTLFVNGIATLDSDKGLYLVDNYTNTITYLTDAANAYQYTFSAADSNTMARGRFVLLIAKQPKVVASTVDVAESQVVVYPNPSNGQVTLSYANVTEQQYALQVIDNRGVVMYEQSVSLGSTSGQIPINKVFPAGVYTVKLMGNQQVFTEKMVVVH